MINNLICVNFNYSLGQTIYLIGKMTFDLVVTIREVPNKNRCLNLRFEKRDSSSVCLSICQFNPIPVIFI